MRVNTDKQEKKKQKVLRMSKAILWKNLIKYAHLQQDQQEKQCEYAQINIFREKKWDIIMKAVEYFKTCMKILQHTF